MNTLLRKLITVPRYMWDRMHEYELLSDSANYEAPFMQYDIISRTRTGKGTNKITEY